jgi:hypothetical protein
VRARRRDQEQERPPRAHPGALTRNGILDGQTRTKRFIFYFLQLFSFI